MGGVVCSDGTNISLSFKLEFLCSNDEAEYMTLILLMSALHMGIHRLYVQGDTRLIIKQVNGACALKEIACVLMNYHLKVY